MRSAIHPPAGHLLVAAHVPPPPGVPRELTAADIERAERRLELAYLSTLHDRVLAQLEKQSTVAPPRKRADYTPEDVCERCGSPDPREYACELCATDEQLWAEEVRRAEEG